MAIRYRAPQASDIPITNIPAADPSLPPDIPYPGPQENSGSAQTTIVPFELVTASAPPFTQVPTHTIVSATNTPSSTTSHSSAPATSTAAASHGLSPIKLTVAIVVPIVFLAIIIPFTIFSYLSHKRRAEERKYAARRLSHRTSREREHVSEKQQRYSAPTRPQRPMEHKKPSQSTSRQPPIQQPTRHSLGLFNFELSTSSSPSLTNAPATPNFRLSIARALEMRRSDVAVVQSHNRTSGQSGEAAQRRTQEPEQPARSTASNHDLRTSTCGPPPSYASPRSDPQVHTSHFAPLERIGTRSVVERRSHIAQQLSNDTQAPPLPTNSAPNPHPQSTPRASSEILQSHDADTQVLTRSTSDASSSRLSAHNNGPFSYGLPERLSDVSRLSFDVSLWNTNHPRDSDSVSVVSAVSSSERPKVYPHHII